MKTSELRIGNLVELRGTHYQISSIHGDKTIRLKCDDENHENYSHGSIGCYHIKECIEIPLTEEWLLKFGFEKNNNNQFILMTGSVDILFNKDLNGWTCDGINFSINMTEHVHQLQNLYFALTSEELKIK